MMLVGTAAVALLLVAGILATSFIPARGRALTERFALAAGIPLDDALELPLRRRLLVRERVRALGGLVGVVLAVGPALALSATGAVDAAGAGWLLAAGMFGGLSLGITAAGLLPTKMAADSPRVARTRAVELGDYVAFAERTIPRVVALIGGVLAILSLSARWASDGGLATDTWITAVVSGILTVVFLVVAEVGARAVVSRGRPAGSEIELAWDDALRAASCRDLLNAPIIIGIQAFVTGVLTLGEAMGAPDLAPYLAPAAFGLLMVGAIAALILGVRHDHERHYLRRLWPELNARREAALYGAGLPAGSGTQLSDAAAGRTPPAASGETDEPAAPAPEGGTR